MPCFSDWERCYIGVDRSALNLFTSPVAYNLCSIFEHVLYPYNKVVCNSRADSCVVFLVHKMPA